MNKLWYGDNLTVMQGMRKHSVDLIYLDPPFKSDANYNLLYKNMTGKPVPEQAEAFFDTWELDAAKLETARSMPILMRETGIPDHYVEFWRTWMLALKDANPQLLAYLIYMTQRLLYMKGILRPTGSIYLHCDPTASHYIKVMMDGIFGHDRFLGEIVWQRAQVKGDAKRKFAWNHDVILAYAGGKHHTFNPVFAAKDETYIGRFDRDDGDGRGPYHSAPLDSPSTRPNLTYTYKGYEPPAKGWRVSIEEMERLDAENRLIFPPDPSGRIRRKLYASEQQGPRVGDVWTDIHPLQGAGGRLAASKTTERLGYPTQKPVPLLRRIIESSTDKGQVVFDPFCGCGTTIYAAEQTGRKWIGCDIAILSVKLVREVLTERYRLVEGVHYEVDGIPVSVEQANELFHRDPFQFQHWVVERVGGFPMQKKVADRGIDGRLYFEADNRLEQMILSVKGGRLSPANVRDLRGVMERERTALAGFLCLQEPTKAMRAEAAEAGVFIYKGVHYPRIQLLTVREILEEKREFSVPARINTKITSGQQSLPL